MSAVKMLAAAFADTPCQQNHRPRPREREAVHRNRQRKVMMDTDCHMGKWQHWQCLPLADERALTLMYVGSHHPSVKHRVARIIGDGKQEKLTFFTHKTLQNAVKNGFPRCHSLQPPSRQLFSLEDPFKLKMLQEDHGFIVGKAVIREAPIAKPIKLSPQTPTGKTGRPATRPKTGILPPHSIERQRTPQRRIRTAVCRDGGGSIKNNSFVGWEQTGFDQEQFLH